MRTHVAVCLAAVLSLVPAASFAAGARQPKERFRVTMMYTGPRVEPHRTFLRVHIPGLEKDLLISKVPYLMGGPAGRPIVERSVLSSPYTFDELAVAYDKRFFSPRETTGLRMVTPQQAKSALALIKGRRMEFVNGTGASYPTWNPFPDIRRDIVSLLEQVAAGVRVPVAPRRVPTQAFSNLWNE